MRVHVGRLGQIATVDHIARIELAVAFENVPALILAFGHMHILDGVVGHRIDGHVPGRAVPGEIAAPERVHHRLALMRAGHLDRLGPQHGAEIAADADRVEIGRVGTETLVIAFHERLVGRQFKLLVIGLAADDAVGFFRGELHMLVADAEGARDDRNLVEHAGRRPLTVEAQMRGADQAGGEPIGLGLLDFGDRRAEFSHIKREMVPLKDGAAEVTREFFEPCTDNLRCVVVGADIERFRAALREAEFGDRLHPLHSADARDEIVDVANAAFVDDAVPQQGFVFPENRPDHFARRAGDGAMHKIDLFLERRFLGILRIKLHARLRIVFDKPDFLAVEAAGGVDFLDRELAGHGHRRAVNIEAARLIEQRSDDDLVIGLALNR